VGFDVGKIMTDDAKINRARRSLVKAVGLVATAVVATAGRQRRAAAGNNGNNGGNEHCFLRGTRIRTADGYRPIEILSAGDRVATRFAGLAPIQDISTFTLRRTRPGGSWIGARPVRVKRGALGENVPTADICLTGSHAVITDGFLVPVGDLINGTSIVREMAEGHDTLDFFHIELAAHEVLDAEGAGCESLGRPSVETCVPLLSFQGGRSELCSRLRSMASIVVDHRTRLDIIRDDLEYRGLQLARAA
jgi:Hint domain